MRYIKTLEDLKKTNKKPDSPIIAEIPDDKVRRKALEQGSITVLLSPEKGPGSNTLRQADSGFNEILGRIATKNNIALGINLSELKALKIEEKADRLSKIAQNLKVCRKTKTKIALIGESSDYQNILLSLGASTEQIQNATQYF